MGDIAIFFLSFILSNVCSFKILFLSSNSRGKEFLEFSSFLSFPPSGF